MDDGNVVTITVGFAGSATAAAGNLSIINESYFTGFAFQMDPASNDNPAGFANYERIDLEFSPDAKSIVAGIGSCDRSAQLRILGAETERRWNSPTAQKRSQQPVEDTGFREVGGGGIEPPTPGFSILCSTN